MSNDAKKYLDSEGLSYFWDKIKDYVGEAVESGTSDIANKIHFVAPNEKEAIQALTAAVSDVDALSPGLVIALRMPFDSVASQTLNINNLGAKPIYYRNNTTDAGVFPSGAIVLLIYETTSVGTGCFKAVYSYDGAQPNVYQGATSSISGIAGLVPAALSNEKDKFLKGDGTWAEVSNAKEVSYSTTFPTDQSVASLDDESIIFYEEDSSNIAPEVLFVSTSGNQSISGVKTFADGINAASVVVSGTASASQFIGNGSGITGLNGSNISSGTIAVERLPVYQGATTSAAGVAGLVPSAAIADKDLYLKGDGTWAEIIHPSAITSAELSTGTDTLTRTVTAKVIHDYVAEEIASGVSGLVNSAPAALDTLNELAAALGNDPNFATTISGQIGSKLDASSANYVKGLSISGHTITYTKGDNTNGTLTSPKEVEYSTTEPTASSVASLDNESVIFYETQNMAAGTQSTAAISISGNAGTADSVNHSLSVSVDGGAFEGSTLYTFNGSTEKTVNIAGGTGITLTGASGTITISANPFRGATSVLNGAAGSVPAPTVAEKDMFLRGDGSWATVSLLDVYQGATSSNSGIAGLVPAASSAERERFLKGDGTWAEVVQPAIVTSSELSTGTDATVRTISPKVIHDYVAGEVASGVAGLVNSAPAALDTLNELASALGNDANFATTVATNIGTKLDASSANYVKSLSKDGQNLVYTKGNDTTQSISLVLGVVKNIAIETSDVEMVDNNTAISTLIIQPTSEVLQKLSTYCNSSSSLSKQFIYDGTSFSGTDEVPSTWNSKVSVEINKRSTYWTIKAEPTVKSISNSQYDTPTAFEMPFGEHTIDVGLFDSPVFTRISYTLENDSIQFTHYDLYSKDLSTKQCVKLLVTNDNNTTSRLDLAYVGATDERSSRPGLVPSAFPSEKDCFLCGDGTWDAISGMTNAQIDTAMANVGYVGDIDPSLLTSITNAEIDALFA